MPPTDVQGLAPTSPKVEQAKAGDGEPAEWAVEAMRAATSEYASHMGDPNDDGYDDPSDANRAAALTIERHAIAALIPIDQAPDGEGREAIRLGLEDAGALRRVADEADENGWLDWGSLMRQAADRIDALAKLHPNPSAYERGRVAEVLGEPSDWVEKREELYGWTGSAWLAGEPGASQPEGLYSFLCSLIGYLAAGEDAARALSDTPAEPDGGAR